VRWDDRYSVEGSVLDERFGPILPSAPH
jgi:hypothetical protein